MSINEVILHLGVHKTATTHFQSRLNNSKEELANRNVGYLSLNETRQLITSRINNAAIDPKQLEFSFDRKKIIIISDENLIGGTEKIRDKLIYPDVENRLKYLVDVLPAQISAVHITIRDPEAYLISRYCEYLRHYSFLSAFEYFDSFDIRSFSWLPLVNKIKDIIGKEVSVTLFEDLFNNEDAYLKRVCGVDVKFQDADKGSAIRRSKITQETYRVLENLADHYPRHMTKKLMNMMDNNQQRTKGTPFKPFSVELSKLLKENYESDKAVLGLI